MSSTCSSASKVRSFIINRAFALRSKALPSTSARPTVEDFLLQYVTLIDGVADLDIDGYAIANYTGAAGHLRDISPTLPAGLAPACAYCAWPVRASTIAKSSSAPSAETSNERCCH